MRLPFRPEKLRKKKGKINPKLIFFLSFLFTYLSHL